MTTGQKITDKAKSGAMPYLAETEKTYLAKLIDAELEKNAQRAAEIIKLTWWEEFESEPTVEALRDIILNP